jgi:hypothetical protein
MFIFHLTLDTQIWRFGPFSPPDLHRITAAAYLLRYDPAFSLLAQSRSMHLLQAP